MKKIKTEYNPYSDCTETYYWDDDTQTVTIKNTFDVGAVLESNKRKAAGTIDSRYGNQVMHHVADIPNVFITKFKREHNIDVFSSDPAEQKRLRRLLETPEYRFLKTTVKRLWRPRGAR